MDENDKSLLEGLPWTETSEVSASDAETAGAQAEGHEAYPRLRVLGNSPWETTYLVGDRAHGGRQRVQRRIQATLSREWLDLVEVDCSSLSRVSHPYLSPILDYGYEGDEAFWLRDFETGQNWFQALAQADLSQVLKATAALLCALDALESRNIFHLHLKPENIFLRLDGAGQDFSLKLTDFGRIAWFEGMGSSVKKFPGTPPYVAPEWNKLPRGNSACDLYAVGVLVYGALAKRLPFDGASPDAVLQQQRAGFPPLPPFVSASSELVEWLKRLLAYSVRDRFQRPREALKVLVELAGSVLDGVFLPPPASDGARLFDEVHGAKQFRRILFQGHRWAFYGPRGSGKSFLARWMERYFLRNQKRVRVMRGGELFHALGEDMLSAQAPTFLIVDDADQGPCSAWLEGHAYAHVIVFGEELEWARYDPQWKCISMAAWDENTAGCVLESLGIDSPFSAKDFFLQSRAGPGAAVSCLRSWAKTGLLQGGEGGWRVDSMRFRQGLGFGKPFHPLAGWEENERQFFSLLALSQVALPSQTMARIFSWDEATWNSTLSLASYQGLVERWVASGQEYYRACFSLPERQVEFPQEEQVLAWCRFLGQESCFQEAIAVLGQFVARKSHEKNSAQSLCMAELLIGAGRFQDVFKWITAPFVETLIESDKALAYERLGIALLGVGRGTQGTSALKQAYGLYREQQNILGQGRIFMELGTWSQRAGQRSQALKFFEQALSLLQSQEARPEFAELNLRIAQLYAQATDDSGARRYYERALDLLQGAGQIRSMAEAYRGLASCFWEMGDADSAEAYAQEALHWIALRGPSLLVAKIFLLLAEIEAERVQLRKTRERLDEAAWALRGVESFELQGELLLRRAELHEAHRQDVFAQQDLKAFHRLAQNYDSPLGLGRAHLLRAKLLRRDSGAWDQAQREFASAIPLLQSAEGFYWLWEVEFELGEISRSRDLLAEARAHYQRSLQFLDRASGVLSKGARERFLKDGKRQRVEAALRWLGSA